MNDRFNVLVAGVYVYGALAIGLLFVAGALSSDKATMAGAIITAGFAYFSQNLSAMDRTTAGSAVAIGSLVAGVLTFARFLFT